MITNELTKIVGDIFASLDLPAELGRITLSNRPDLADFQCNGAMQAARVAKKNPREIAQDILNQLEKSDAKAIFETIEIAGPGFLNFKLSKDFLSSFVTKQIADTKLGYKNSQPSQRVLVEFCSPNVAKDMHIGHMRTTVIGDTLARLVEFSGNDTVRLNYLGDWGTPMGIVIETIRDEYPDLAYFKETDIYPDKLPFDFETLNTFYPKGAAKVKEDKNFKARVDKTTADFQKGDAGYRALWRAFYDISLEGIKKNAAYLGAHFDVWEGESTSRETLPGLMEDLQEKNLLEDSEGAVVIRVDQEDDKQEYPPVMMLKSNGAVGYHSTDVATVYRRVKNHNPDRIIYVTDYRQALHFEQVFRASKKAGYADNIDLVHVGYGTLNDTDGKPYKTRSGGVPSLDYFCGVIKDKAIERLTNIGLNEKMSEEDFDQISDMITLASIRFADLSSVPRSDYVFDIDQFVSFEGKTGPYIQYTAVRLKALIDKANEAGLVSGYLLLDDTQTPLALSITQFPEAVQGALENYAPNILCEYLFNLAQKANTFYQNAPVLKEEDVAKRESYLALLAMARKVLEQGLDLIGIEVPTQM